jgi:hypothetical protein
LLLLFVAAVAVTLNINAEEKEIEESRLWVPVLPSSGQWWVLR